MQDSQGGHMNIPKLLRPFRNKMFWESAIKAAISSLALGALGVFLTALINRILIRPDSLILLTAVGAGIFAIAFTMSRVLPLASRASFTGGELRL